MKIFNLFQFNISNKTLIIFIASIIWIINFRTTFKNIDNHMDTSCYSSLKYDPHLILIKNILSCLFFVGFFFEIKVNRSTIVKGKELIKTEKDNTLIVQVKEKSIGGESILNSVEQIYKLNDTKSKILFWLKNICLIIIVYFIEEIYFIVSNNHILDRIICPIRNLGVFISLLILSPLLIKKTWVLYRHQLLPIIIILILSAIIIFFNFLDVERFQKIYGIRFFIYLFSFILMGLEFSLIKYLVDSQFINIYLILGIKGIVGTLVFTIIYFSCSKKDFFEFLDDILRFEYEDMYIDFNIFPKVMYIVTFLIIQYLKIYIINIFTENHLLPVLMISDIIYFPFYIIERFIIQNFEISNNKSFCLNISSGITNVFMILIFNEILECKFWGLNQNLVKNIYKRQKEEYLDDIYERHNDSSTLMEEMKEEAKENLNDDDPYEK